MMDLGSGICRPKAPLCGQCPLAGDCRAFALGTPEAFPTPKARKTRPRRHGIAFWIERDDMVWLVRRQAKGMLGGMAALPGPDWQEKPIAGPAIARVTHIFTHFALDLAVAVASEPVGEGWWQPIDRLGEAGLPTLYRKAVDAVLGARTALAA
jgi:A/G-specific adenine glycosylase